MFGLVEKRDDEKIKVYVYHPETHEYINSTWLTEQEYEKEVSLGASVTTAEPKYSFDMHSRNQACVFNTEKNKWEIKPDYRGFTYNTKGEKVHRDPAKVGYYLPLEGDEPGSPRRFNETFGPLPEGAVTEPLPKRDNIIQMLKSINGYKYTDMIAKLISSDLDNEIPTYIVSNPDTGNYEVFDYGTQRLTVAKSIIVNTTINAITRAALGDESAKKIVQLIDGDNLCEKIDQLSMCYHYYNSWLDSDPPYKDLYQDYKKINYIDGHHISVVPDYEKLKIELTI